MKQHPFSSHTPEEMRRLSNLGHAIEGLILCTVSVLALLSNFSTAAWVSSHWPVLIFVAGILLFFLIYPRHPLSDWPQIWRDAQQREHSIIAVSIAASGLAELLQKNLPWLGVIWPAAMLLIGSLFLFHAQHGTSEAAVKAVRVHRILGITIVAAGLLGVAELITGAEVFAILWPVVLIAAAVQLLIYREPKGAYEDGPGHEDHGEHRNYFGE